MKVSSGSLRQGARYYRIISLNDALSTAYITTIITAKHCIHYAEVHDTLRWKR